MAATSYTAFLQSMSHLGSVWTSDGGYLQVLGQALKAKSKIKEWAAPATAMQLGTMRAALTRCPMSWNYAADVGTYFDNPEQWWAEVGFGMIEDICRVFDAGTAFGDFGQKFSASEQAGRILSSQDVAAALSGDCFNSWLHVSSSSSAWPASCCRP